MEVDVSVPVEVVESSVVSSPVVPIVETPTIPDYFLEFQNIGMIMRNPYSELIRLKIPDCEVTYPVICTKEVGPHNFINLYPNIEYTDSNITCVVANQKNDIVMITLSPLGENMNGKERIAIVGYFNDIILSDSKKPRKIVFVHPGQAYTFIKKLAIRQRHVENTENETEPEKKSGICPIF